jgi:hypothetical protein
VTDGDVRVHLYRSFVETGAAPSPAETARTFGTPVEEAEAAYRRLEDAHVIVLAPGTTNVWMAPPLSAVPTPFRVQTSHGAFYGNCIWDALGVVAMLGGDGTVRTSCQDCGDAITLTIRDRALEPASAVAHFAVPARHWWDNIGYT